MNAHLQSLVQDGATLTLTYDHDVMGPSPLLAAWWQDDRFLWAEHQPDGVVEIFVLPHVTLTRVEKGMLEISRAWRVWAVVAAMEVSEFAHFNWEHWKSKIAPATARLRERWKHAPWEV